MTHFFSLLESVSYRDPSEGTVFINALCQELQRNEASKQEKVEILTFLTRVNYEIQTNQKLNQSPVFVSFLQDPFVPLV
jgi:hypothetical protein